jgi:hypothetical protein
MPRCDDQHKFLHTAKVKLRLPSVTTHIFDSVCGFFAELHNQSPEDFVVFDDHGRDVRGALPEGTKLIRNLLNGGFFVQCHLTREAERSMEDRIRAIEDFFVKPETDYVHTLEGFRPNVEPVLQKIPNLPAATVVALLDSSSRICFMHFQSLEKLTQEKLDFFFPLGGSLCRLLESWFSTSST